MLFSSGPQLPSSVSTQPAAFVLAFWSSCMRSARSASIVVVGAVAPLIAAYPLHAQEAAKAAPEQAASAPAAGEDVMLPEISVESEAAPAKRNKKKQALKGGTGAGTATTATTALPGVVVEGEKVVRTLQDTTTSIGVVTGQQIRQEQIEDMQGALNTQANVLSTEGQGGNSGFTIRGLNSE